MKTDVTELGDSRTRVDVEVEASEVDAAVRETAEALGKEMKIPGLPQGEGPRRDGPAAPRAARPS